MLVCKLDEDAFASSLLIPFSLLPNPTQRFLFASPTELGQVYRVNTLYGSPSLNLSRSLPWLWTSAIALSPKHLPWEKVNGSVLCVVAAGSGRVPALWVKGPPEA